MHERKNLRGLVGRCSSLQSLLWERGWHSIHYSWRWWRLSPPDSQSSRHDFGQVGPEATDPVAADPARRHEPAIFNPGLLSLSRAEQKNALGQLGVLVEQLGIQRRS